MAAKYAKYGKYGSKITGNPHVKKDWRDKGPMQEKPPVKDISKPEALSKPPVKDMSKPEAPDQPAKQSRKYKNNSYTEGE